MADLSFVHLHVASGYSLRHGASSPRALVTRAADLGMDALALTDRDGVYGAVKFVRACQGAGITPILGVDLSVARATGSASPRNRRRTPVRGGAFVDARHPRVVVLARNGRGWAAICRLVSAAHREAERGHPLAEVDTVGRFVDQAGPDALFVLLGPDSDVGYALARRRPDHAIEALNRWRSVVPASALRIELVSHQSDGSMTASSRAIVRSSGLAARMLRFAVEQQLVPVLGNAVRHATPEQARVVDVLDAVRRLVPLDVRHLDRVNAAGSLRPTVEMAQVAEHIANLAAIGNDTLIGRRLLTVTRDTADECRVDPRDDLGLGQPHLPEPDPRDPRPVDVVLRDRCIAGIGQRGLVDDTALHQRLDAELDVIASLGFASYFLTVGDVVDLIRDRGIRVAARGSGAGSLVNHLLGISGVNPLEHGLLFERFLSPLRGALPDIDVDVESARRTEIYEQILERFGEDRTACVSMMETYRVRHAIRDVGAALGMPPSEIGALATAFPHIRARDARNALKELPELRASGFARHGGRLDVLLDLVEGLDGLPRHVALHPCGIVLSNRTLLDRTPVESSWMGFPMSQFDKDDVEELGLLKLDVLGIRMQSAMAHAIDEVERIDGEVIDIDAVPRDDPATFDLVRSTRTLGCFQIESPGQRELIGKFGPETFDDLIIDISLFRPGPVKSDMVSPFLRARQGWTAPVYAHDDLIPALQETYGVVVFHEQVIKIVSIFAGCSLAEGDEIRRALSDADALDGLREWFYQRARARGYALFLVERVWDILRSFGSFGFCKAHAAAFALPTYQSAWLKAHHPAAFLAGVLTHDPGMYPKRLILDDARQFGITVLPLDVNASDAVYRVEQIQTDAELRQGIRLSLAEVKGIRGDEVERIVEGQPFADLADFWSRAHVARPVAERLVLAGAFDDLHGVGQAAGGIGRTRLTRRDLLLRLADLDHASMRHARSTGQLTLGLDDDPVLLDEAVNAVAPMPISGLPEMNSAERVRAELDVLGLDVSRHVVDFYVPLLRALGVTRSRELLDQRSGAELLVAGVKVATQTPPIRSGRRVVFLTLDDATGPSDLVFFDDVHGEATATVFHGWLLLARGELRRTGPRGVSVRATGCWELSYLHQVWTEQGIDAVRQVIASTPRPGEGDSGVVPRRVLVHPTGFKQSPYSDIKPAGAEVANTRTAAAAAQGASEAPRTLWHSSPGSAGR